MYNLPDNLEIWNYICKYDYLCTTMYDYVQQHISTTNLLALVTRLSGPMSMYRKALLPKFGFDKLDMYLCETGFYQSLN